MNDTGGNIFKIAFAIAFVFFVIIGGGVGGCAAYNSVKVWNAQTTGKAELAQAQQNRQIKTLEARAKAESAAYEAEAYVRQAEGRAKANHILQQSLGGPAGYLRYLQIEAIDNKDAQLIYVPTEGGLPILAGGHAEKAAD